MFRIRWTAWAMLAASLWFADAEAHLRQQARERLTVLDGS